MIAPASAAVRRARWRSPLRLLLALVLGALLLVLLLLGLIGWEGAERAIHPPRQTEATFLADYPFARLAETVRFPSRDGTPLAGWYIPGQGPAAGSVVLLPSYGHPRAELLPHAAYLHAAGYNVLLLDFRNTGESGGSMTTFGMREPLDVLGAVDALQRQWGTAGRIAIQGVSLGATSGLLAMADDQRIAAAVAESAFPDLDSMIARNFQHYIGLPSFPFAPAIVFVLEARVHGSAAAVRPVAALQRLGSRPVLLIDDAADQVNPPGSGARLAAAATGPVQRWEVAGAGHAAGFSVATAAYQQHVLDFYRQALGEAGAGRVTAR